MIVRPETSTRNIDNFDPTCPGTILPIEPPMHSFQSGGQFIAGIGCENRNEINVAHVRIEIARDQRASHVQSQEFGSRGFSDSVSYRRDHMLNRWVPG